jgi:hypothetical protein
MSAGGVNAVFDIFAKKLSPDLAGENIHRVAQVTYCNY